MLWWIASAYALIALAAFVAMVRNLEPLDGAAWLSVTLAALFWPVALVVMALP
jgi:hypothetical protein